jgi:hypothetical protein
MGDTGRVRRAIRMLSCLLALAPLTGCGGVHGHGTGPSLGDLIVPLAGTAMPAMSGPFDLDRYAREFAAAPEQERPEFVRAGFVAGCVQSTTDSSFGRRLYLMRFRDRAAAHQVFDWYRSFVRSGTFSIDLRRENYGRVASYRDSRQRSGSYAQVLYPAGPLLVVVSVTVAAGTDPDRARAEAGRLAAEESARLP